MHYSENDWSAAAGHRPLRHLDTEDVLLLHRHWMWSNQLRESVDQEILSGAGDRRDAHLASRTIGFMFVWYAMLWSLIEACLDPAEKRNIELRGRLRADIDQVSDDLRRFRNAVLHVPRTGEYHDKRLVALVQQEDIVAVLRRLHSGFGRLFLEELKHR